VRIVYLSKFKITDNEPCPCGSEKAYKDCCKGKQVWIKASKKPPEVQVMEKMRRSMKKCCLHPDQANCKRKIKAAHALQNNKIISLLAGEERHVYSVDEVFIDITGYLKTYNMTAREITGKIIHEILDTTGITATAGIGTNLYL